MDKGIFGDIAFALSGPRGSGRTCLMIDKAPRGAKVLTATHAAADLIRLRAKGRGREDLTVIAVNGKHLIQGMDGPFVADHFAIETWLHAAQAIIDQQGQQIEALKQKLAEVRRVLAAEVT